MNHPKMKYVYCGIDSHKETHYAVVLNCFFEKIGELEFRNAPSEFEAFLSDLSEFKTHGVSIAFGLEDVSAYGRNLTAFLKSKKQVVKHVNASLVPSERNSMNTLHKTDSVDAECAARVLLSKFDGLPDADTQDKYWVLNQLVMRRRLITKMNSMLKTHTHSYLTSHYPSYTHFFSTIDCKSGLAFFEKYPSPSTLKDVSVEELESFLADASSNKAKKGVAKKILEYVRKDGDTTTDYQEIRDMAVKSAVRQIKGNYAEIEHINGLIEDFLQNFDYKLESMNGIDTVTAADLIAEIGDIKKFSTPAKLARYAGIAPATYSSGKTNLQYANERGNRVLNQLFYRIAVMVIMTVGKDKRILNPFFYHYYKKKISEGKTKGQAIKCVERRLVNIIWRMMTYNMEYLNPPAEDSKENSE